MNIAGLYEQEIASMLANAFQNAKIVANVESTFPKSYKRKSD